MVTHARRLLASSASRGRSSRRLRGILDAPAEVRTAFEAGRACDTRVLYQLAKGVREKPAAVGPLLAGDAPLTRDVVETALREPRDTSAAEEASSSRRIEGSKLARALLVEHAG